MLALSVEELMRRKRTILLLVATAALLALASACGGAADDSAAPARPTQPAVPPSPTESQGVVDQFLGLALSDASALAEEQERPWRIGRDDDERFALTQDYVVGRVTFELDDGVVTAALVEGEASGDGGLPNPGDDPDDDRGRLLAVAIERLVKEDNSFGGGTPFERVEVETAIGGSRGTGLSDAELELIAAAIENVALVEFIPDADQAIEGHFESAAAVAVVSVGEVRIDGERAEVDLGLWCGNVCGIWLTYEAERTADGWRILGINGPIAVS